MELTNSLLKCLSFILLTLFITHQAFASIPVVATSNQLPCHHPVFKHHRYHHKAKHHHRHKKKCHRTISATPLSCDPCCQPMPTFHCVRDFSYHRGRNAASVEVCVLDPCSYQHWSCQPRSCCDDD